MPSIIYVRKNSVGLDFQKYSVGFANAAKYPTVADFIFDRFGLRSEYYDMDAWRKNKKRGGVLRVPWLTISEQIHTIIRIMEHLFTGKWEVESPIRVLCVLHWEGWTSYDGGVIRTNDGPKYTYTPIFTHHIRCWLPLSMSQNHHSLVALPLAQHAPSGDNTETSFSKLQYRCASIIVPLHIQYHSEPK